MTTDTPTTAPEPAQPAVDRLMNSLIQGNAIFLAKATTPMRGARTDEEFLAQCLAANYAGAAARLLDILASKAPALAELTAEVVYDAMEDGESIADWVGDEAARRGIDIEAITAPIFEAKETP